MSSNMYSYVECLSGTKPNHHCGYCKAEGDTSYSYGMWAHQLTPGDYQTLIDRGWRRSGKYCYKPNMKVTCCPQYTISLSFKNQEIYVAPKYLGNRIVTARPRPSLTWRHASFTDRCSVLDFKLSRSHKKVLKRMYNFLARGVGKHQKDHQSASDSGSDIQVMSDSHFSQMMPRSKPIPENLSLAGLSSEGMSTENALSTSFPAIIVQEHKEDCENPAKPMSLPKSSHKSEQRVDPDRPPCKKAKLLRRERRLQKLRAKAATEEAAKDIEKISIAKKGNEAKSLVDFLTQPLPENPAHKLEIRTVPSNAPLDPDFQATFKQSYAVYRDYQVTVHKDPPKKCSEKQFTRFLVNSPLQIKLVPSSVKLPEYAAHHNTEYEVYKRYQMTIHREKEDECSESTFKNFLVVSPLQREHCEELGRHFGSYHQQYWLDDKLIAVGVIDILPYCVSSVYLFYDPDYSFLSLGTYTTLREIAFVRELQKHKQDLQYYYMGFYIHSCPKMRYKGQYYPSYLLCPETYTWHPIEKCLPKLDASKYSRLEDDPKKVDEDGDVNLGLVKVYYNGHVMPYEMYSRARRNANDQNEVREYAHFVGSKCARSILLDRY